MQNFAEYQNKYPNFQMRRDSNGVLEVTLHTAGKSLVMSERVHNDLGFAFTDIGADTDNRVMILTGAGTSFCVEVETTDPASFTTTHGVNRVFDEAVRRDRALLEIPFPIVSAINGAAFIHADIPLLGDIVLAAETAAFRDFHLPGKLVPGGIAQVIWQELLGTVRANYFLLTGQILSAAEALRLGVVSEVVPDDKLLERARRHARRLAAMPPLVTRSARYSINQRLKTRVEREAPYGYALIGLAALDAALEQKNASHTAA